MKSFAAFITEEHDGDKYFRSTQLELPNPNPKSYRESKTGHDPKYARVVHMHPDHFLHVARNGESPDKHKLVHGLMSSGTKFSDMPELHFQHSGDGHARVSGHEGRHRAMALKAAGVKSMPVILKQAHNPDAPHIDWTDHSKFHGTWPHTLHGEKGPDQETSKNANNHIPFPVKDPR